MVQADALEGLQVQLDAALSDRAQVTGQLSDVSTAHASLQTQWNAARVEWDRQQAADLAARTASEDSLRREHATQMALQLAREQEYRVAAEARLQAAQAEWRDNWSARETGLRQEGATQVALAEMQAQADLAVWQLRAQEAQLQATATASECEALRRERDASLGAHASAMAAVAERELRETSQGATLQALQQTAQQIQRDHAQTVASLTAQLAEAKSEARPIERADGVWALANHACCVCVCLCRTTAIFVAPILRGHCDRWAPASSCCAGTFGRRIGRPQ